MILTIDPNFLGHPSTGILGVVNPNRMAPADPNRQCHAGPAQAAAAAWPEFLARRHWEKPHSFDDGCKGILMMDAQWQFILKKYGRCFRNPANQLDWYSTATICTVSLYFNWCRNLSNKNSTWNLGEDMGRQIFFSESFLVGVMIVSRGECTHYFDFCLTKWVPKLKLPSLSKVIMFSVCVFPIHHSHDIAAIPGQTGQSCRLCGAVVRKNAKRLMVPCR